ncbi:MAG: PilZ domain-containing protein [Deltaproteobacteria bacterium]|nr:PilZ domain-containing protein [Deltaproteobacteria bacterium]
MKFNLITLIVSSVILLVMVWVRQAFLAGDSMHGRYYVAAILMISSMLTVITLFRYLRHRRQRSMPADVGGSDAADRHRQHYRLQFDESPHPIFVQRTDDRHSVTAFTCQVRDISETGISLGCMGVYALGQTVQGEVIFTSGRTAPVNGVVLREKKDYTCLQLHCTIDPPLLMAEQREQIAIKKGKGPRPAVSRPVIDKTVGSLPSHSPKGICRPKRT